uniref:NADH-ubiquinone oxidoreductase chain 6 n=1 Tax=Paulhutchinsonia pilosicollis TaxID=2607198 RepID=A0A6H0N428_9CUCU|nr:NADH dehydrogenase subunit 6 [Paulhutchinsonia pilosicollis]QIV24533.1 NADH dehydrogenase subunit 6 [Paulhutchinsonia pilosicollis]
MTTLLIINLWTLSIMFLFMSHPLSFGFILLLMTTMISLITGMMNYNYWFSYVLFIVMAGGMLVLFIYMTSIASNEKFSFSANLLIILLIMILISATALIIDTYLSATSVFMYDLTPQNSMKDHSKSLNKFFNQPNLPNMYMIIIYLFITLIMVVKISNIKYGPLRQKL